MIERVVNKYKLGEEDPDIFYWRRQTPAERLEALEEIRRSYNAWRYKDAEQGFQRVFELLNAHRVEYLVIGGYALAAHGYPRYTKDIDIWVHTNPDNAKRIIDALAEFGFSSLGLKWEDFTKNDQVVQLGYPPHRIDLITGISGANFEVMYARRQSIPVDGVDICFTGKEDLIELKTLSGRKQDAADIEQLSKDPDA